MDFQARLSALGIDPDEASDAPLDIRVSVKSLRELRDIIGVQGDIDTRRARFDAIFADTPNFQDEQLRAAEEFVFGLADDMALAEQSAGPTFPLDIYLQAAKSIDVDGELDLTTTNGELHKVVYGTVTIKAGGYIVAEATPLDFTCDKLILEGDPPAGKGHFNILGKTGAAHGAISKPGTPGQASTGHVAVCGSGKPGGIGEVATNGTNGGNGARGNDGIPSQFANIDITTSLSVTGTTKLLVATQSGAGGAGQNGGPGGDAGKGGNGGKGDGCGCGTALDGGPGQKGGIGGKGGRAGDGGNGVDAAANIVLSVPNADFAKVQQTAIATQAPPGKAGDRGAAGGKGGGGTGGAEGGKGSHKGPDGGYGGDGEIGDPGVDGTVSGKPAQYTPQPK
ncbi:hypothetical protein [Gymnodinialimonas sp.]